MNIINANVFDLSALHKLEKACFEQDAWPLFDLIGVLTFSGIIRIKIMEDDQMVGFAAGDPRPAEGWGWIATLGVDPRYQRRGYGTSLLKECESRLGVPRARLTVRLSNLPAIAMYEKHGYKTIDLWSNYYSDGGGAKLMEKEL